MYVFLTAAIYSSYFLGVVLCFEAFHLRPLEHVVLGDILGCIKNNAICWRPFVLGITLAFSK